MRNQCNSFRTGVIWSGFERVTILAAMLCTRCKRSVLYSGTPYRRDFPVNTPWLPRDYSLTSPWLPRLTCWQNCNARKPISVNFKFSVPCKLMVIICDTRAGGNGSNIEWEYISVLLLNLTLSCHSRSLHPIVSNFKTWEDTFCIDFIVRLIDCERQNYTVSILYMPKQSTVLF